MVDAESAREGEDNGDRRSITITWTVDDVAERCREIAVDLSESEQLRVLQLLKSEHDADVGINWDVVDSWIGHVIDNRPKPAPAP